MMVHPHYQYHREAGDEGEESGPLTQQALEQVGATGNRVSEIEDEEGDGEGEDTVAERFQPSGLPFL